MTFTSLTDEEVDAKSPLDDALFTKIQADLDDLDSRVIAAGATPFHIAVDGKISQISWLKRSIDSGIVNKEFTPLLCRYMLKKSGLTGSLAFDIRKHTSPLTPITGIDFQYSAATQSIGRAGSALNTQSIARITAQINTQSITHAKSAINISSILNVGTNLWQYNLASALDSDNLVGDSIVVAGATSGGNNGTFTIVEVGRCGGANFTVTNASGVAQTGAAGTVQPKIMSYNFTNPVSSEFAAGETALFAAHTSALNDGSLTIYGINQGGNNIWVKHSTGVVQGGVAGTTDCNRFKYALGSAASTTDYIVGEAILTAGHTSALNDGNLTITAVNSGGNNIVVHNSVGVVQGGAAGTINTNRWVYSLPTDPSSSVTAGDTMYLTGHTNALNDGVFTIKEVNRSASSNVVVYNLSGVAQGGTTGNSYSTKKLVTFASDQSAVYTTDSWIEMTGCGQSLYNTASDIAPFKVLQVNRGGGANYNVVIDSPTGLNQQGAGGMVITEMKSVFSVAQTLASSATALTANFNLVGSTSSLVGTVIPAQTPLMLYFTAIPTGDPRDFSLYIS